MRLGARYGFALFSRKPISEFLSPAPVLIREGQPMTSVLETVFSRADEAFYDDVVLLDSEDRFLGLIHVHSLVRVQTQFLRDNIAQLEEQKRVINEKNQQMEEDLVMACEIQLAMLPREHLLFPATALPGDPHLEFARLYQPAQKVGGDVIHVLPLSGQSIGVFIADVMGHGVRSALVTAMLRALVEEAGAAQSDPGALLTQLNRDLSSILRHTGDMLFATAFYLIADLASGTVRYACAGHPRPLRLRRNTGRVEVLPCTRPVAGPGLCVIETATYGTATASLENDDLVLLYTDGIIEAPSPEGDLYSLERLQASLLRHADLSPVALADAILADAHRFTQGLGFDDDVCLAAVQVALQSSLQDVAGPANLETTLVN
ncbi:MAG: SpoIIE family protein phosphatase [Chthoniobacteraceae bacterium]